MKDYKDYIKELCKRQGKGDNSLTDEEKGRLHDFWLCVGMTVSSLCEDIQIWHEKEEEYIKTPNKFLDVTEYDDFGNPILEFNGKKIPFPPKNLVDLLSDNNFDPLEYWDETFFLWKWGLSYEELALSHERVYVLLEMKMFVKDRNSQRVTGEQ